MTRDVSSTFTICSCTHVEFLAGTSVNQAAAYLEEVVKLTGSPAQTMFNGCHLLVRPGETARTALSAYETFRATRRLHHR